MTIQKRWPKNQCSYRNETADRLVDIRRNALKLKNQNVPLETRHLALQIEKDAVEGLLQLRCAGAPVRLDDYPLA
jgi:hypothetical protein